MKELYLKTSLCRAAGSAPGETFSQPVLAVFPDKKYLRGLLKECARLFFGAKEGSRTAELIEKECYPDLLIYPKAEKKLTAENCAEILEESILHPVEAEKKLFLFDGFDDAPALLQNKLLKLFEEPPESVFFLLGAESEYPLLPTILSRVKKFALPPFSEEEIFGALFRKYGGNGEGTALKENYPRGEIVEAAAASGGIFSVAENILICGGEEFRLAEQFLSLDGSEAFCRSMEQSKNKREFFAALKAILRDILMIGTGQERFAKLRGGNAAALAREYPAGAVIAALRLVSEAEKQVRFNANFASCLYALALGVKEEKEKWKRLS